MFPKSRKNHGPRDVLTGARTHRAGGVGRHEQDGGGQPTRNYKSPERPDIPSLTRLPGLIVFNMQETQFPQLEGDAFQPVVKL